MDRTVGSDLGTADGVPDKGIRITVADDLCSICNSASGSISTMRLTSPRSASPNACVARKSAHPQAIPVLLKHLALDYPERVLFGIGAALHDRSARAWWSDLREMLLNTDREVVQDRLAVALSLCATREHYDDLLAFVGNEDLGECRIYFLRPINRIGNRIQAGQGHAAIERVATHPVLGREATAILKGKSRSQWAHAPAALRWQLTASG